MKLDGLRNKIDDIDRKIIDLISQRLKVAKKIRKIKNKENIPVTDSKRETEVLLNIHKYSISNGLDYLFTEKLYRLIIRESKKVQQL